MAPGIVRFACLLLTALAVTTDAPSTRAADAPAPTAETLQAVVGVRTHVPGDSRTARSLGSERVGSGVVIGDDGLVLTIGYLILEADTADIMASDGRTIPAAVVAYDHETGFGLLRAVLPIAARPMPLGDSAALSEGSRALVVSFAGPRPATPVIVASRRPFAGYWEYLLEDAIFTVPPHPMFGGAALIGADGRLLGIGSLFVHDAATRPNPTPGNMFVPIDRLKPILSAMVARGRSPEPPSPWIGAYTNEAMGRVIVVSVAPGGPAERAGLKTGDLIVGVNGAPVTGMVDYLRKLRAGGPAGTAIRLEVLALTEPDATVRRVDVHSSDRGRWLHMQKGY